MLRTNDSGRIRSGTTARWEYAKHMLCGQRQSPHDCHALSQFTDASILVPRVSNERGSIAEIWNLILRARTLEVPALRIGDKEIAEYLDARDRFEFFRIDKIGIERERVGFAE